MSWFCVLCLAVCPLAESSALSDPFGIAGPCAFLSFSQTRTPNCDAADSIAADFLQTCDVVKSSRTAFVQRHGSKHFSREHLTHLRPWSVKSYHFLDTRAALRSFVGPVGPHTVSLEIIVRCIVNTHDDG